MTVTVAGTAGAAPAPGALGWVAATTPTPAPKVSATASPATRRNAFRDDACGVGDQFVLVIRLFFDLLAE
ncbi:hypothetical protein GCM10017790_20690 [Amycolatopsis oliviviridis]|uniref:Uncharacterized protein n=1 Tax=Amycolatopsis oliviviridis TaxID=1471590 RepID=A0ABQ3LBE7_9PSEU|nr:hypothetical protein GCM10017790_20690 [Amycolatopsis oliviviridis]